MRDWLKIHAHGRAAMSVLWQVQAEKKKVIPRCREKNIQLTDSDDQRRSQMASDRQDRTSVPDISPDHLKFDWTSFFCPCTQQDRCIYRMSTHSHPDTRTFYFSQDTLNGF